MAPLVAKLFNPMKTTEPKSPAQVGLSLIVCSGPRGCVRDEWPCIEYTVQLQDAKKRPVWTGEYRLGVGHVKSKPRPFGWSQETNAVADALNKSGKWLCGLDMVASVAAALAAHQKVAPKLEDVCHSLIMDGAAYFDGQRFEDWAADFGYSDDSIKAKETFDACDRIGRDLKRALSADDLAALREWASNY